MNKKEKIDELYAYLAIDSDDGTEGIISFDVGMGPMPMISSDMENVEGLRPIAKKVVKKTGAVVRLVRFTKRDLVETLEYDD